MNPPRLIRLYRKNIVRARPLLTRAVLAFITIGWCVSAGAEASVDDPPDSVSLESLQKLYEPVVFDHAMHLDLASCSRCHHHTTGEEPVEPSCRRCHRHPEPAERVACSDCHQQDWQSVFVAGDGTNDDRYHIDIPRLQGALHLRCLGCHLEEEGPTGCQDCHASTAAGKHRFDPAGPAVQSAGATEGGAQ